MVGKYRAYPEYKETGHRFIGEIPSSWTRRILGSVSDVIDPQPDHRAPSICNDGEGFPYIGIRDINKDGTLNFETARPVEEDAVIKQENSFTIEPHNIVFCKVGTLGLPRKLIPHGRCALSATLVLIKVKKEFNSQYLLYALDSDVVASQTNYLATGSTRSALGIQQIRKFQIPVPSQEEQEKIANFLDHETAKIDTLIDKQQLLITLLKEKRQAVISHAVTKGLNPDAPMRDSGVEWLGEVPAHWEIKRLRYIGICQNGINIGAEYFGTGYPFVSYSDAYKNETLPKYGSGLVKSTEQDRQTYSVLTGDVFFTRTSETIEEIGFSSTCMVTIKNATFAGFLIRFRPKNSVLNTGFSKYYFRNMLMRTFFIKEMNLVTRASLSQDLLKKLPVALPPLEEQVRITEFLDTKSAVFEKLTKNAETAIELMKERRTALISAAVTGKIDVRHHV
ncbi:MAG TPA: restriction endonuclease subunit S [Methylophaga aminisulfidivorans]|uniref:Restriction endonuclease subunit S n=2 Tax=root TaxID=1 RepID=A0A7C1VRV1_9GAMM|nr:restriction endonuclease subunit S [Methylophaga aminisulfidivorans]